MKTLRQKLWDVATDQYGYVTTNDARELGENPQELAKLAYRNKLAHIGHGLYRFDEFPSTERDEFMKTVLATGVPAAVLSHDTALMVHELCDINPTAIHVTVPKAARVRRHLELTTLHHDNLDAADRGWWEGIPVATVAAAIRQGIETNVPHHLLAQAMGTARARGQLRPAIDQMLTQMMEART